MNALDATKVEHMSFIQENILWGLPLILLPVIIHLINRMRHKPRQWGAMQFLLAATRSSTSHSKIKNWLMEMQEYSWYLLDKMQEEELTLTHTRQLFIDKYGTNQVDVFDSSYEGLLNESQLFLDW